MNITGNYTFEAPSEKVWGLLMNTGELATCIPGCKELKPLGNDMYQADLSVAVAAVTGNYITTITMADKVEPVSYRLVFDGTGRMGFVKGSANITLAASGDKTTVNVIANAEVGGTVARVGQRLMEGVARMMMDRFFACLRAK